MSKIKSIVKSVAKPTRVSEFVTLTGTAVCDLNASSDTVYRMNEYLNHSQIIKHKIKRAADDIVKSHNQLATSLSHLADLFVQLEETQLHLVDHRAANTSLSRGLRETLNYKAKFEREKAKRFDEYFTMFYKYNYFEQESFKSLLKERESLASTLRKAEDKLRIIKANLWTEGNTSKWDLPAGIEPSVIQHNKDATFTLMLHSKNSKVRDYAGFFSQSCREEFDRMMLDNTFIENRHFAAYADGEGEAMIAEAEMWRNFNTNLDKIMHETIPTPDFAVQSLARDIG